MKFPLQIAPSLTVVLLAASLPVGAMVRQDNGTGNPLPYTANVAAYVPGGTCSGTVIGNGAYVITAKHCTSAGDKGGGYSFANAAGQTIAGNASLYVYRHPTMDVAIVPLAGTFSSWMQVYTGTYNVDDVFTFVGVGVSATTAGSGVYDLGAGTFRVGQNKITTTGSSSSDFTFRFDLNGPNSVGGSEAQLGFGDSGSGSFVTINGTNYLIGVNVAISGGTVPYQYNYTNQMNYAVPVSQGNASDIYAWLSNPNFANTGVPEPGSLSLLAGGSLVFFALRRRIRRAKRAAANAAAAASAA